MILIMETGFLRYKQNILCTRLTKNKEIRIFNLPALLEKIHIYELFTKFCFQRFDFLFLCTIIIPTLCAITIMYVVKYQIFLFFPYFQVEHFTRYGMHEYLDDEQLAKKLKRSPLKPHLQVHRFTFCVVKVKLSFCIITFTIKYKVLCGSTAEEVSFEWSHPGFHPQTQKLELRSH